MLMSTIRIALGQMNPIVGDIEGNVATISRVIEDSIRLGAHAVALPELAITGYPPEDLLMKGSFVRANIEALHGLAAKVDNVTAIVGFVDSIEGENYNAAAIIHERKIVAVYHKHLLPNYGVFDEQRYFRQGEGIVLARIGEVLFGVTVCEDLWGEHGPHEGCARAGADLVININASPYHMGKGRERQELLTRRARENGVSFAYVNMVGGQDELIFDGQSCVVDASGEIVARASQFAEEVMVADLHLDTTTKTLSPSTTTKKPVDIAEALRIVDVGPLNAPPSTAPTPEPRMAAEMQQAEEVYSALVVGVRDYLGKNGFRNVLIGISGGIDSALTAAIAVDALGAESVVGISNPSEYTSTRSVEDAEKLAANLGFHLEIIPIGEVFESAMKSLAPVFGDSEPNVAEENLQARIRGLIWMAISNKFGRVVLSTGNKSEMAVGYATLYGDMSGGFAVLKDVPKTLVYRLAKWRNRDGEVIPESIITRPPTAELRPDQLDTDSLPPYEVLDPILESYVEDELSIAEIVSAGFDETTVRKVAALVDAAEYKRRQAPPGIKVTDRAFGRDRRVPITNRYRPYI